MSIPSTCCCHLLLAAAPPAGARRCDDRRLPDHDGGAAGWAGCARSQPSVDAGDVEGVGAAREHAQGVSLGELGQADGALGGGGGGGARRRAEGYAGQRIDGLLLEPLGRGLLLIIPAGGVAPAAGAAGDDETEAEDADERAEQPGEDEDHVRVEGVRRRARAGRWRFDE